MEDAACVLGIPKKDFAKGPGTASMDTLSPRQLAYCLSSLSDNMTASDLLETGGEIETRMRQSKHNVLLQRLQRSGCEC